MEGTKDHPAHDCCFSRLCVEEVPGDSHGLQFWRLVESLVFSLRINGAGGGAHVLVPSGFVTDFASVPRAFWAIFPPFGAWSRAAVLHDYLYGSGECSRWLADCLFREAMEKLGVPWWRRVVMFWAVRLFGARHKTRRAK